MLHSRPSEIATYFASVTLHIHMVTYHRHIFPDHCQIFRRGGHPVKSYINSIFKPVIIPCTVLWHGVDISDYKEKQLLSLTYDVYYHADITWW